MKCVKPASYRSEVRVRGAVRQEGQGGVGGPANWASRESKAAKGPRAPKNKPGLGERQWKSPSALSLHSGQPLHLSNNELLLLLLHHFLLLPLLILLLLLFSLFASFSSLPPASNLSSLLNLFSLPLSFQFHFVNYLSNAIVLRRYNLCYVFLR